MSNVRHAPDIRPVSAASAASRQAGGDGVAEPAIPPLFSSSLPELALPGARGCGEPWHKPKEHSGPADLRLSRRSERYRLREVLWDVSTLERLRKCGRRRLDRSDPVTIWLDGDVAHFSNLQFCGSTWSCPVCHPKIANERAEMIAAGCGNWVRGENLGRGVCMSVNRKTGEVTEYTPPAGRNTLYMTALTFPHYYGQPLDRMLADMAAAFSGVVT